MSENISKEEISKRLRKINRQFDKWFKNQSWYKQKKWLTKHLIEQDLLDNHKGDKKKFWKAFDAILDVLGVYGDWDDQFSIFTTVVYLSNSFLLEPHT